MSAWSRIIPFESLNHQKEIWIYNDGEKKHEFEVDVTLGKTLDTLKFKANEVKEFDLIASKHAQQRSYFFSNADLECISICPICKDKGPFDNVFNVYGASYNQCKHCLHWFVATRPTQKYLDYFYSKNLEYQSIYVDKALRDERVEIINIPKAQWIINLFEKIYNRKPNGILDVGAGSGHFVYACKKLGMRADGVEISESGISFCKENFGIELYNKDFLKEWNNFKDYEIVTFWGVIEHVTDPLSMLKSAHGLLSKGRGLVVAEVPRMNCVGTIVQSLFPDSIIRHLEPLNHPHCFSDSSLATAFMVTGFDVKAAWYFGMDAHELILQFSNFLKNNALIQKGDMIIPAFQKVFDLAKLSDAMVLVGKAI
jgi:2-polyprenyl-3-methyl-5-hydroxy-6-metoxy-1,4-benzoquinol methylase